MEVLENVYRSRMRLFRDRPDILTEGRWYWCPPGAIALPFLHAFGGHNWDYDGFDYTDTTIGEVDRIPGYANGIPNPRYTGQRWCGSQEVWARGALFAARGTPAADADGVPFCCQMGAPRGGDQVEGNAPVVSRPELGLWWRPEGLAAYAPGSAPGVWSDDANGVHPGTTTWLDNVPWVTIGQGGWKGVVLRNQVKVNLPSTWSIGNQVSTYVVFQALDVAPNKAAVVLDLANGFGGGAPGWATELMYYRDNISLRTVNRPFAAGEVHIEGVRRSPSFVELHWDGAIIQSGSVNPAGVADLRYANQASMGGLLTGKTILYEVMVFPVCLTDAEHELLMDYLNRKYFLGPYEDIPVTGTVIAFAGSAVPDGYLPCDGAAVSRTTYAALFAALGTAWGVGDGSTTFNVPDLRGRAVLGTGTGSGLSARTLGQTGGEENHQLVLSEIPTHQHNAHYLATSSTNIGSDNIDQIRDSSAGGGVYTTDSQGGDGTHNNMQPWAAVQWLVKT